jgi:glycosyl transferase family 87
VDGESPSKAQEPAGGIPLWIPVLLAWAVLRQIQVSIASGGFGNDVVEYFGYARAWVEGKAPYVDFQVEYPPGALLLFLLPLLVGGRERYVKSFVTEMAVFDLLTVLLVLGLAARAAPGRRGAPLAAAGAYLGATALLHPVLYARFDVVPAVLVLAALWLLRDERPASPVLLGLAAAVKLWPLGLAPLWLGQAYRRSGSQGVLRAAIWIGLGFAAPAVLLLPRVGMRIIAFLEFHRDRGIQIESTWGTLALLLDRVGLGHASPVFEFGAWDVQCGACSAFAGLSLPLLAVAVLVPQLLALRTGALGERDPGGARGLAAACAAVLGILIAARVLSPQYLLWVCPLVALSGGWLGRAGLVLAAALTSLVYPVLYPELVDAGATGHGRALAALVVRNLLLATLYALALRASLRPLPAGPTVAPAPEPPTVSAPGSAG